MVLRFTHKIGNFKRVVTMIKVKNDCSKTSLLNASELWKYDKRKEFQRQFMFFSRPALLYINCSFKSQGIINARKVD